MFAHIFTFAGELPKELGKLANLEVFSVAGNSIGGGLYVPSYTRNSATHITEFGCVHCTVTEEEKVALKAKLPKTRKPTEGEVPPASR